MTTDLLLLTIAYLTQGVITVKPGKNNHLKKKPWQFYLWVKQAEKKILNGTMANFPVSLNEDLSGQDSGSIRQASNYQCAE